MSAVRVLLIALVVAGMAVACDQSPTAVGTAPPEPAALSASLLKPPSLVPCAQSYDSVTRVIGPKGGYVAVGSHYLVVDSLVLPGPVSITAVAPAGSLRWVRFRPDGLKFPVNRADGWGAVLLTNFGDCGLPKTVSPRLAQVTDALGILTYLQTYVTVGQGNLYVAGLLPHFSNYAVAW
jgi:hypothetical protein